MTPADPNGLTRRQVLRGAAALAAGAAAGPAAPAEPAPEPGRLRPVPIRQVEIDDAFWSPKLAVWRNVTIGDCFTKFENDRGGAINNFDLVRDGKTGTHAGPPWYDGLIYEMIRGSADFLASGRDPALEARIDGYIGRIAAAQARDTSGYVNTWTETMLPQSQRWGMNGGDDRWQHDVYNAGMMIEAGIHYYRATGHAALLEAATRMANVMCRTIGPSPRANVIPGHSGPEEALVELYRLYRDDPTARRSVRAPVQPNRYLALAEFFIDARGHYEGRTGKEKSFGAYGQDHAPLAQQASLEGHAVRAALYCTGIAALAAETGRADYLAAAQRFWDSLVRRKMYVTGAAGSTAADESLGPDYFLPNDGYMETCAAVALAFFGRNMNLLLGEAKYVDALERALYNAALGGVALAGDRYYYQDPLAGNGLRRWSWHECPCCPPMFLKLMGALPGYVYAQDDAGVYVNLYAGSRATLHLPQAAVRMRQATQYPWDGAVRIAVDPEHAAEFDLYLRIPDWCQPAEPDGLYRAADTPAVTRWSLTVNGRAAGPVEMVRGYARVRRRWKSGDVVDLTLPMPVRHVAARPEVEADRGRVALMRGPIVYCAESVDNPEGVRHLVVERDAEFTPQPRPELLGGVHVLRGRVPACYAEGDAVRIRDAGLTAVPFYASANREACSMQVWLAASPEAAVPATLAALSRASASHCWHLDSAAAINDGFAPAKSSDTAHRRLSWWDHKGTEEWAQLDFPRPATVSKVRVFWFADRPAGGGCDVPASWRLLYRDGDAWRPVERATGYGVAVDRFNEATFAPVTTTALRIVVQLQPGWSGGLFEVEVE